MASKDLKAPLLLDDGADSNVTNPNTFNTDLGSFQPPKISSTIAALKPETNIKSHTYNTTDASQPSNANAARQATLRHLDFDDQLSLISKEINFGPRMNYLNDYDLTKARRFERQNFDPVDSEITHLSSFHNLGKSANRGLWKWFTCIMIGVCTGFCMVLVTSSVEGLQFLLWLLYRKGLDNNFFSGYMAFLFFSLLCACVASGCVFYEPRAAGSGIPEVKAYLNGSTIPNIFHPRTVIAKLIGVAFAVSGSFIVGKEGPMVHAGSGIASAIGMGGIWCKFEAFFGFIYGSDIDRRDLISMGAAAGVSAAFGAPIGGMLFALEEVSSFWRPGLNWRAFFCAAVSNFTVLALLPCFQNESCGDLQKEGLIDFVDSGSTVLGLFNMMNFICFIFLGAIGGLIGMAFNHINVKINIWRIKKVNKKPYKMLEVLVVCFITVSVMLLLPLIYGKCIDSPCDSGVYSTAQMSTCNDVVKYGKFTCEEGKYNDLAALLQPPKEFVIKGLFYYQTDNTQWFSNGALWIAFFAYFFVSVITYGIAIPSGLFVPIILIGSTFGHVMGIYFNDMLDSQYAFDVGTYSLLGAAALLGGTTRMTISLTVILVEITNDVYYLIPIIMTIMVAKWVGDTKNPPLYDSHIELKHIPFLEPTIPNFPTFVVAKDIMNTPVVTLPRICSMKRLFKVLSNKDFQHNSFPIVISNPNYVANIADYNDEDNVGVGGDDDEDRLLIKTKAEKERDSSEMKEKENPKLIEMNDLGNRDDDDDEFESYYSDEDSHHLFIGAMLRSHIMAMINNKCYAKMGNLEQCTRLTELDLEKVTYRNQQLESLGDELKVEEILYHNDDEERNGYFLDFTPYMHLSPFLVRENTPVLRLYSLFRSLGLRHLIVTNIENEVVGMITTENLIEHNIEKKAHEIIHEFAKNKTRFALERMEFLRQTQIEGDVDYFVRKSVYQFNTDDGTDGHHTKKH